MNLEARVWVRGLGLLLAGSCSGLIPAATDVMARESGDAGLVWHVEMLDGEAVASRDADVSINPASVVKVATSLWALDRLGADYRFETRFATTGQLEESSGTLRGDLLVRGSADPDFHVENAYLVARALNGRGIRVVDGALLVNDGFWIGWEGGSERKLDDPVRRARLMASRLRNALDPGRQDAATRRAISELRARRGWDSEPVPRVVIDGRVGRDLDVVPTTTLLVHRSNPLLHILKRFDSYSNNDIERLERSLGTPGDLARYLKRRWPDAGETLEFETLSGLGSNRMTPRQVVRLLRNLESEAPDDRPERVLPVSGCDPGTLNHFPSFDTEAFTGALVAKTGTLTRTDGGIAVLAGYLSTRDGVVVFCVAAPGTGKRLSAARAAQERWLIDLAARHGGPRPRSCAAPSGFSDDDATIQHQRSPSDPAVEAADNTHRPSIDY